MVTLADIKLLVGYEPDSGQVIRFADGPSGVKKFRGMVASVPAWRACERIKAEMIRSAWLGAKVGAGTIALLLAWVWYRGVQGYAGTGKITMLDQARVLTERKS